MIAAAFASTEVADRYESLIRIAASIRAQTDHRALFGILAHELCRVVPFDAIAQYDEASNKVDWYLSESCRHPVDTSHECADGSGTIAAWVFEHQEPVVIETLDGERRFPRSTRLMREAGLQSVYGFPLTTAHRRLGSLVIASMEAAAWSEEEVRFCTLLASQIALAMDDAINFQALRRAQERLELLLDITNRVGSNLELRGVLRELAASIRRVMQCDGAGVALPDPEGGRPRLYALDFPENPGDIEEGQEPAADENESGHRAMLTGEPVVLNRADIEAEWPEKHDMQSAVHIPLPGRTGILGILTLATRRPNAFTPEDVEFLRQVARQVAIPIENARAFGEASVVRDKLEREKLYLENEIRSELRFEEIVGRSEALRRVLRQVETVAPTGSTVLIYGETGTGKELIARAVHDLSERKEYAFVKLNCAAIPTGLLESEMFGHERGAFTGAIAQRVGRFELANRGTMFLDEIGDIPLDLQPKLLRVLQEREFERLGSTRTLRTDARLIAATNRDLEALVSEQKFRSDLYYRLNVFPVRVPSLRERPEDIPLLVRHFVQQFSRRLGRAIETIPSEAMDALVRYPWPGNIRELQNVVERAVILTTGPVLHVAFEDLRAAAPVAAAPAAAGNIRSVLDDTERQQILAALEQSEWIVAGAKGAAARLGMKRSTLQSRMQKLGIRITRGGSE